MKSSTLKETIKNLIPVLSKKEKQDILAYYTVYEKYAEVFSEKATEDLKDHPVFGKLVRDIPKDISVARNKLSRGLQKDAIINDNWQPYVEYQIEQGITYAKMGLDFKSWYEVIALVRNYLTPYLHKEYGSGTEFLSAINGMTKFMDIAMGIIGEAYMQEKEGIIKQANERLISIFETTADIIFVLEVENNERYRFSSVNKSFQTTTGIPYEAVIEKYVNDIISQPSLSIVLGKYKEAIEGKKIKRWEDTTQYPKGLLIGEVSVSPMFDEAGNCIRLVGTIHDITERKNAEEALRSNEAKLKQAQAIAQIGSWELDFATNIATWSEEACRIHGLLPEENKRSFESWLSFIHPEDLEYVKKEIEKSSVSLSDSVLNHRIIRKDGTVRNICSISKFVLNHEGKPIGLNGISHDVTEQKIAEEEIIKLNEELEQKVIERTAQLESSIQQLNEYKHFFNNNNDLCGIANTDGYFEIINANFKMTLGYSENEFLKTPFIELIHPDDIPATLHEYDKLKSGALVINFVNRYRKKDGSYLYLDWNATPNPITQKLYCVARDITERKKTEEQLDVINKELEAFSYSVSHDLRAPLRIINGFSKILKEDYTSKLDADGISTLDAIMNNSKQMGILIDDLLAFSRLGRKEISTSEINMTALVKSVKEEELAGNTNEIEFLIHALPPAKGDRALIKQVWVNLISNAIKYSKHKPKTNIEIGSYYKDHEIVYFVKDNGVGFDMQYYDNLFGVFQRLHSPEEFEGTGVGLAIVKKIIHRHKGTIWAESKLNEETCFYFSLPNIKS